MKKSELILGLLLYCGLSSRAQFVNSVGVAAGISYATEEWNIEELNTREEYVLRLNGAALAEFFNGNIFQWRSELMYNELGTKEVVAGNTYINKTNYISFNNYLKIKFIQAFKSGVPTKMYRASGQRSWAIIPYLLIGPRVEYLFSRSPAVFPDVIDGMNSFHVSGAAGLGAELSWNHALVPFIEAFYNRDITPAFQRNIPNPSILTLSQTLSQTIYNSDFELRIGLKYVFNHKNACPTVNNSADLHPPKVKQ